MKPAAKSDHHEGAHVGTRRHRAVSEGQRPIEPDDEAADDIDQQRAHGKALPPEPRGEETDAIARNAPDRASDGDDNQVKAYPTFASSRQSGEAGTKKPALRQASVGRPISRAFSTAAAASLPLHGTHIREQRLDLRRGQLKMRHFQSLVAYHDALGQRFLKARKRVSARKLAERRRLRVGASIARRYGVTAPAILFRDFLAFREQRRARRVGCGYGQGPEARR